MFAYDGQGHLIGGYDANGQSRREYIWLGDRPVALVQGGKTYALHTDQLGTPRAVTDPNGTVVWRWDGEPFGHTAPNTDPDGNGVPFTLNLRFPGQYADTETGLYYNYHRYYDSNTGRYVTSDPIGLDGGINTYEYALNNPIRIYDPFGQEPNPGCVAACTIGGGIIGGAGGYFGGGLLDGAGGTLVAPGVGTVGGAIGGAELGGAAGAAAGSAAGNAAGQAFCPDDDEPHCSMACPTNSCRLEFLILMNSRETM